MGSRKTLSGKSILILEDEPLVALDTTATLQEAGATTIVVRCPYDAFSQLCTNEIAAALLDIKIGSSNDCEAVCVDLGRRGIPFSFYTGYSQSPLMGEWASVPVMRKPASSREIVRMIETLVALPEA